MRLLGNVFGEILLHDWWLVKADPDSHGKRLGIGGFAVKENQGIRCFSSAAIVKRHDAVTLETVDGIKVMVHGYLNRSRTLEHGFSLEVCDHFQIGFPYYWEDFAAISDNEEPVCCSASKGVSPSESESESETESERDASYKPPAEKACGSNLMSGKKETTSTNLAGGPLTRSRARLLANRRR